MAIDGDLGMKEQHRRYCLTRLTFILQVQKLIDAIFYILKIRQCQNGINL